MLLARQCMVKKVLTNQIVSDKFTPEYERALYEAKETGKGICGQFNEYQIEQRTKMITLIERYTEVPMHKNILEYYGFYCDLKRPEDIPMSFFIYESYKYGTLGDVIENKCVKWK